MDGDVKATGLKQLQGLIWETGYRSGVLRSHVFPDVRAALSSWRAAGLELSVYSSGSVAAQRLFFQHTIEGDLSGSFRAHYDTTTGPKREPSSYRTIAADMGIAASEILFLSDVPQELDAARTAGMAAVLVERPSNAPVAADVPHPRITFLGQIAPTRPTLSPHPVLRHAGSGHAARTRASS
jgi:enolase-phosphatase E1